MTIEEAFEKAFPKVYENPKLHVFKDEILEIVLGTIEELWSNASTNDE